MLAAWRRILRDLTERKKMDEQMRERLVLRQKELYRVVRANRPGLYERAVQIGHLAMVDFGGRDENKRAAGVEHAVMSLVAELEGIVV